MLHTQKKHSPTESIQQRKQKKIFPYRAKTAAGCWRWCCILSSVTFMLRSSLPPFLSGRAFELKITHRVGHQLKWEKMKREGIEWKMRLALAQNIFKFPTIILRFLHRLTTWTCCKLPEKLLHFLPFSLFPFIVSIPTCSSFFYASLLLLSWMYSTELNLLHALRPPHGPTVCTRRRSLTTFHFHNGNFTTILAYCHGMEEKSFLRLKKLTLSHRILAVEFVMN